MSKESGIGRVLLICGVAAIALVVGFATQPAAANLVANGGFETGTDPGSFVTLYNGDTSITGWTVINGFNIPAGSGSIDYIGTYWAPSEGSRSLDLDGLVPGGVQQSFTTVFGQKYHVAFDMRGNTDGPPAIKALVVTPDGTTVFSYDPSAETGWVTKGFDFTAAAGISTTLMFQSNTIPSDGGAYGAALDNVVVEAIGTGGASVPEPLTMIGAFMGISSLGMYIRRRTRA